MLYSDPCCLSLCTARILTHTHKDIPIHIHMHRPAETQCPCHRGNYGEFRDVVNVSVVSLWDDSLTSSFLFPCPALFSSEPPVIINSSIEPRLLVLINFGSVFVVGSAGLVSLWTICVWCESPKGWDLGVMQVLFIPIQQIKAGRR